MPEGRPVYFYTLYRRYFNTFFYKKKILLIEDITKLSYEKTKTM